MTAGVETADATAWAKATLEADAQFMGFCPGGAHEGLAPAGVLQPWVTLWIQSSSEYNTFNGVRIWTDVTMMAKYHGPPEQWGNIRSGAIRGKAVLNRGAGGAQGAVIISSVLMQQLQLPEPRLVNGVQWTSYAQIFHLQVA